MTFSGPGALDTGGSGLDVGAGYGQTSCPDQYLVEIDSRKRCSGATTPSSRGLDADGRGTPCDEHATMDVFVFDGTAWKVVGLGRYAGARRRVQLQAPGAVAHQLCIAGLDGTSFSSAMSFQKARIAVGARQGSTKVPVFVSAANLNRKEARHGVEGVWISSGADPEPSLLHRELRRRNPRPEQGLSVRRQRDRPDRQRRSSSEARREAG